ncbi:MAG TPA: hypothetical protein VH592_21640 [Gemmataceae bacterium]
MSRSRLLFVTCATLLLTLPVAGDRPAQQARNADTPPQFVGRWTVTFANGVVETCAVRLAALHAKIPELSYAKPPSHIHRNPFLRPAPELPLYTDLSPVLMARLVGLWHRRLGGHGLPHGWVHAIMENKLEIVYSNFDIAGLLTETILFGNFAMRAGKKLEWGAENMEFPNFPELEKYLHFEYRNGWTL